MLRSCSCSPVSEGRGLLSAWVVVLCDVDTGMMVVHPGWVDVPGWRQHACRWSHSG